MKKATTLIVFILSTLFISGCSITQSPEELTAPPKLEGDKEDIKLAINEYLPKNTKPIIPPTDDSGSYIKLIDLDGDGKEEALVFYTIDQDENPIRILVLKKLNEEEMKAKAKDKDREIKWKSISEIKVEGQDLEKVEFKDLDGDNGQEIIIGSRIKYALDKDLRIHTMNKNETKLLFNSLYEEMIIDDLNNDGSTELMLLKRNRENNESFGELYKYVDGKMDRIDKVSFNENAEINFASYDYIHDKTKGIILSTTVNEDLVNIYMMKLQDNKLVNLFKNTLIQNKKQLNVETLTPKDVNGDGVIEFSLPNKPQEGVNKDLINWVTEWYSYDGKDGTELKQLNYYDEKLNFTFDFPLKWKDKLTITNLTKNENTIKQEEYVKVEYKDKSKNTHLFTIYIYDKDKIKRAKTNPISEDYKKVLDDINRIYYMRRNDEINENNMSLINDEIKKIEKTFKVLEK